MASASRALSGVIIRAKSERYNPLITFLRTFPLRRRLGWLVIACAIGVALGALWPADTSAQAPRVRRLVAIGDLHADIDAARLAFQLAGATDRTGAWIGGDLTVVQMGDVIGRGSDDLAVLNFVLDVRAKAKAAGGVVHVLIGNHEVFAARPDHRWVNPDAFEAFDSVPGLNLRHPRLSRVPANERARSAAFMPGGPYALHISAFPAVLRVGDTIFAHGGVTPKWARYGIAAINDDVRAWLLGRTDEPPATQGLDDGSADDGVMWSRHFAAFPEEEACAMLKESLTILGARRMVVAHTVRPKIVPRCQEQVWPIDVGISRYYGGALQVLEIIDDREIKVISAR